MFQDRPSLSHCCRASSDARIERANRLAISPRPLVLAGERIFTLTYLANRACRKSEETIRLCARKVRYSSHGVLAVDRRGPIYIHVRRRRRPHVLAAGFATRVCVTVALKNGRLIARNGRKNKTTRNLNIPGKNASGAKKQDTLRTHREGVVGERERERESCLFFAPRTGRYIVVEVLRFWRKR